MPGLDKILQAIGLGPDKIVEKVAETVDRFVLTKEEKEALKLELQKELNRHYETLANTELEQLKADYAQVADARSREVQLRDSVGVWVQNGAAVLVIASFVGLLFCVLYREGDLANKDIFNVLLGSLGTVVVQIFQYWFGSSLGSARKQQYIEGKE